MMERRLKKIFHRPRHNQEQTREHVGLSGSYDAATRPTDTGAVIDTSLPRPHKYSLHQDGQRLQLYDDPQLLTQSGSWRVTDDIEVAPNQTPGDIDLPFNQDENLSQGFKHLELQDHHRKR